MLRSSPKKSPVAPITTLDELKAQLLATPLSSLVTAMSRTRSMAAYELPPASYAQSHGIAGRTEFFSRWEVMAAVGKIGKENDWLELAMSAELGMHVQFIQAVAALLTSHEFAIGTLIRSGTGRDVYGQIIGELQDQPLIDQVVGPATTRCMLDLAMLEMRLKQVFIQGDQAELQLSIPNLSDLASHKAEIHRLIMTLKDDKKRPQNFHFAIRYTAAQLLLLVESIRKLLSPKKAALRERILDNVAAQRADLRAASSK